MASPNRWPAVASQFTSRSPTSRSWNALFPLLSVSDVTAVSFPSASLAAAEASSITSGPTGWQVSSFIACDVTNACSTVAMTVTQRMTLSLSRGRKVAVSPRNRRSRALTLGLTAATGSAGVLPPDRTLLANERPRLATAFPDAPLCCYLGLAPEDCSKLATGLAVWNWLVALSLFAATDDLLPVFPSASSRGFRDRGLIPDRRLRRLARSDLTYDCRAAPSDFGALVSFTAPPAMSKSYGGAK